MCRRDVDVQPEASPLFPRNLSEDGFLSIDGLLRQAGGFGRCQWMTNLFGVYLWAVHGAQVMTFVFIGTAVEEEFADDRWLLRLTGSFFFVGWMGGLGLWGWLASKHGWLIALAWMEALVVLGGVLTAASANTWTYLLCRTLVGFAEGGVPTCAYGYASEFLLPAHKTHSITALQLGFIGGSMLLAVAASNDDVDDASSPDGQEAAKTLNWRALTLATALCALPVPILVRWLPESPRWLLRAGRTADCARVLRTVSCINGAGAVECDSLGALPSPPRTIPGPSLTPPSRSIFGLVLQGGAVTRVTCVVALHAFAYTGAYFGLSMVSARGHSNVVNLVMQIPVVFVAAHLLDQWGRRMTLVLLLGGLAATCTAMAVLRGAESKAESMEHGTLHGSLATLGCVLSNGMFSAGYVCSAEMFPTEVRSVGLSTMSQAARLGGAMAPLILLLEDYNPRLPFLVWGGVAGVASLAALLLPETRGKASMETLDDLSSLVALPSPIKSLGSSLRSQFRASDGKAGSLISSHTQVDMHGPVPRDL